MKAPRREYFVVINKRTGEPAPFSPDKSRFGFFLSEDAAKICLKDHFEEDDTVGITVFTVKPYAKTDSDEDDAAI